MKKSIILLICIINSSSIFSQTRGVEYAIELFNQGVNFLNESEYPKAVEKFKNAQIILERELDSKDTLIADCSAYLAYSYIFINRKADALKYLMKAFNIYNLYNRESHLNYKGVLYNIAKLNFVLNNFNVAERYFLSHLEIVNQSKDSSDMIVTLNDLINIYKKTLQNEKLEGVLKQILLIYPKTDKVNYTHYLIQASDICGINNKPETEEFFRLTIDFIRNNFSGDPLHIQSYIVLENFATYLYNKGEYSQAEQKYLEIIERLKLLEDTSLINYASLYYNLGLTYQKLYNYEKGKKYILKAIKEFETNPNKDSVLLGMCKIALASIKKDNGENLSEVIQINKEAIKILKLKEGLIGKNYINAVQNLANVYCLINKYAIAIPMYLEVIDKRKKTLGINHPEYAKAISNLGYAYLDLNDYKKAKKYFGETLINYEGNFRTGAEQLTSIYSSLSQLCEKQNDTLNLLSFNLKAIKSLNRGNVNNLIALSESEKLNYLDNIQGYYNQFKSTFYLYGREDHCSLEQAYNNEMQNKSFALKSTLEIKNKILSSGDTALISSYNFLVSKKEMLAKNYSLPAGLRIDNLEQIENDAENLEKIISQKVLLYPYVSQQLKLTFNDIKRNLKKDDAAIEFINFQCRNKNKKDSMIYGALIIRPDYSAPKFVYLFEENELQQALTKNKTTSYSSFINELYTGNQYSNILYKLIWKPIDSIMNETKNIYLSSTGLLHKVSIASIPFGDTISIGEKYNLKSIGTTANIVNSNYDNFNSDSLQAIIFGGIDYENAAKTDLKSSLSFDTTNYTTNFSNENNTKWNYLPGSMTEALDIKNQFEQNSIPVKLYADSMATENQFKNMQLNGDIILHIATHGYFYPDSNNSDTSKAAKKNKPEFRISKNPLFRSGLILAGVNLAGTNKINNNTEDGILTSYEVSNCDLRRVRLAVLSACETALGDIKGYEGVFGLQRSFRLAGAQNLIMSLWKVSDEKTKELMHYFYIKLIESNSVFHSFNYAKRIMHRKYPTNPFYWAGFILVQ